MGSSVRSAWLVSWPGGSWEATLTVVVLVVASLVALTWLCLVAHTYCDIARRTTNPLARAVCTLLVAAFFLPGYFIYVAVRPGDTVSDRRSRALADRLMLQELQDAASCPECGVRVSEDFVVCPQCRATLKARCRSCAEPLRPAWLACPYCTLAVDDGVTVLNPKQPEIVESVPAAAYLGGFPAR